MPSHCVMDPSPRDHDMADEAKDIVLKYLQLEYLDDDDELLSPTIPRSFRAASWTPSLW